MKKSFLIVLTLILSISLAACSGNKNGNASNTGGNTSNNNSEGEVKQEPVTITVSGYPAETDKTGRANFDARIKAFQEKYPNVTVKPDTWQYNAQEFAVKMAGNSAPDVIGVFASEGRIVAERGWAADLTELIRNWQYSDQYSDDAFKLFEFNGKRYGFPKGSYVMNIMYNKALFDKAGVPYPKAGWTWDQFIDTAKKLTNREKGISGFGTTGKGGAAAWIWSNFLYQAGGEVEKFEGKNVKAAFDSDAGVKALQFYKDLRWKYDVLNPNALADGADINTDFGNGKIAMITHGDWVVSMMMNQFKMKPDQVGIVPMPVGPSGKSQAVQGGSFEIINANVTDKDKLQAAFDWITFLETKDEAVKNEQERLAELKSKGEVWAHVMMRPYKENSEIYKGLKEIWDANPGTFVQWPTELYNQLYASGHPEPPVEAQAWYTDVASVIEFVLSNKNANPEELMKKVANDFQTQVLDPYNSK
ncbi:ABC-type glycerol-3-phosphate transport system substrate-binding protein [Paenibacillus taihuensis]|uniref:ABC-type glycerol-3-phosphate transport system substrate-binding protein n=1 Tax=Paenibacillus taihuensis TaxID=1156355 RepID=A0A3D9RI49_9BACL|nr:sugar ABC transporter substrate-binding protein [Paenibacillus taihuensis]REE77706.1 ABC-type glycerol-3-phosphate transport system substrate-binding protein [Paenibacillus taihuensis]